jgi:hypothetical protein
VEQTVKIPSKQYDEDVDIWKAINKALGTNNGQFLVSEGPRYGNNARFSKERRIDEIKFINYESESNTEVQFCPELAYILGISKKLFSPNPWLIHGWKVGLDAAGPEYDADVARNTLVRMWIFADFVSSTIIGPNKAPLLRFVPIQASTSALIHTTFTLNDYQPCVRKRFTELRLWIREYCNSPVNLEIYSPIIFCLHFRRIQ